MNNYGYFFFRHGVKETKKPARIFRRIPLQVIIFVIFVYITYARVGTNINISRSCVCVCVCVSKISDTHKYKALKDANVSIFIGTTSLHPVNRAHSTAKRSPIFFFGRFAHKRRLVFTGRW